MAIFAVPFDSIVENGASEYLSLTGSWQLTDPQDSVYTSPVPSAWETITGDYVTTGPMRYERFFDVPEPWIGHRILLEAQAISYAALIYINGIQVGEHIGIWTPFQVDLTGTLRAGRNEISIAVWKPGDRYPLRESLAGFLPDVATTFGGIWQPIGLRCLHDTYAQDVQVRCQPSGEVEITGMMTGFTVTSPLDATLRITGIDGTSINEPVRLAVELGDGSFKCSSHIRQPKAWHAGPGAHLYTVSLNVPGAEHETTQLIITRRIGLRELTTRGEMLLMNGAPLHLRGVLDWGWNARTIRPAPSRQLVQKQIEQARRLGYNMVKLCLFVPDETTFDVADEEGMAVWLELPMWQPSMTPAFQELALREYDAILRRVHHHPCIVIASLGCELDQAASAGFLEKLGTIARRWLPHCLLCDNSGSAEAYGGVYTGLSDFYDYHFYTDPHYFPALVDHFTRAYRPARPWIYGEFCDADTMRDFSTISPDAWWLRQPVPLDRKDLHSTRQYQQRLSDAGVEDGGAHFTQIGRWQATAVRKYVLEQVRSRHATGGYVVTGWADTPITTSGMVDDHTELKFTPEAWQPFNQDCVLLLDRERRRRWRGGDRPARTDPFGWWQGDTAEFHIALSNGLGDVKSGELVCTLAHLDPVSNRDETFGAWRQPLGPQAGGSLAELAVINTSMPEVSEPAPLLLSLQVQADLSFVGGEHKQVSNGWALWAIPARAECLHTIDAATLYHSRSTELLEQVRRGQKALLWLQESDELLTRSAPFWREAIHVFNQHPLWLKVTHPGYADMRFYSLATDLAIDPAGLARTLGPDASITPVWRRFDARSMTWSDYVVEVSLGCGKLYITTLRFAGGLGYQPDTLETNPSGAWVLYSLINLLNR